MIIRRENLFCIRIFITLLFFSFFSVHTYAENENLYTEISGTVSFENRGYLDDPAYSGQRSSLTSLTANVTFYFEDEDYRSFTLTPTLRYDAVDSKRNLADLKEAYFLTFGDIGQSEWELRLGFDQVFWGVVESRNIVDIVNQTDVADHPDEKSKLGQLMAHLTVTGDLGTWELFAMPFHRLRTFPGKKGRFHAGLPVDNDRATYESEHEERNVDWAAQYSNSIGPLDFGINTFYGTSREPMLERSLAEGVLIPHYETIRQYGLYGQVTTGPYLFKLEAIDRRGASNIFGQKENYKAYVLGAEYSFYSIFDSQIDMTLFVERTYDTRKSRATNAFEDDIFLTSLFTFNDVNSTEFVAGTLISRDRESQTLALEFSRRLTDQWALEIDSLFVLNAKATDFALKPVENDSFIALKLNYSF